MRIITTILFVALSVTAIGQELFSKARITKTDNTTIDCYIRNTAYEGTPQQFDYAPERGGTTKNIEVRQIRRVQLEDGTTYERFAIDVPAIKENYINRKISQYSFPENRFRGDALLEKVVTGKVSLYQYVDQYQYPHFFYTTAPDTTTLVHLPNKSYVDEQQVLRKDASYKNLLSFLVQGVDCKATLTRQMENLLYSLNSMIRITKEINDCIGGSSKLNNAVYAQKTKIRAGLMGGVSSTTLDLTVGNPSQYPGLTPDHFKASLNPVIGAYISFLPRKKIRNYVVSIETYYHTYKQETDSIRANSYTMGKGLIKFSTINISPVIRFDLMRSKVAPFLETGLNFNTMVGQEDRYTFVASGTEYSRPIFSKGGVGFNFLAGAGVDFSRVSFHARYQLPLNRGNSHFNVLYAIVKVDLN